ncbi:ABC transporter permease subunit [Natrarchaeobius chitinivorans]|uniref:ABC transporter permease n=1 Tax=Natrarchaeobius chitinivorans TaxID=1679083 RepID=A0A3N6M6U8_NATCH|nr:ABC transporter permease subunit [Natrarchaeobius chitinivorans]RQG97937.1 ABC transporter permease [Natrarchaeobius chitinivorans]
MTAILRNESGKLIRSSLLLTGLFGLISVFLFAAFPGFADQAEVVEEAFPPVLAGLFGFEELHTIEGFVGGYLFPLLWILFGGMYFAYVAAGLIVGDVRTRKMDLTLSNPVSRESVVLQKVAALWVPLVVLNAGLILFVLAGVTVLGESIDPIALGMTHLLSVPYLLVCAGIGLVLSVVLDREETAQATALGLVFVLWLIDGLSHLDPALEWIRDLTPSRYFDPTAILVHEEYALADAGILLVTFLALVAVATVIFVRRDI